MADGELEIERLNRLYSALRQISQAILRKRSRSELFQRICATLVEPGGFGMAWIGWNDGALHRLVPVSQVGDQNGYLEQISVYTDERAEGRGPSGTAFRENRPYVSNDLFADPASLPWRAELARRGFRASAAFPIHEQGVTVGALTVYSEHPGFFRDKEVALLSEAAADLSFALDALLAEEARVRAEEVVKRFVAIVESTDDAIVSSTLSGEITSWNPAAESMFGYTAAQVLGGPIEQFVPSDHADEQRWILAKVAGGESVKGLETIRTRKDGTQFPVSVTVSPIWGTDKATGVAKIVGASRIVRDITERKNAEALVEREQGFARSLVEAMPSIFYLYDAQGRFLRWNHNFERVSGYSAEEIARMHPLDFFSQAERPLLERRIAEVFDKGEANVEASFVSKNGSATPYFFTGRRIVLDGVSCLAGVGVDISERKHAEDALRRSEERYRTTLETIFEGCQLLSFDWRYLYLNPAAALQNRRPNEELLGRTMMEAWPGIEQSEVFQLLRRCMEGRSAGHAEVPFEFADGEVGWFDVRAQAVPEGLFVLSIDITERKHAEHALRELNENLERKVAERTVALDSARERAEAADRVKSAFLATMSHEPQARAEESSARRDQPLAAEGHGRARRGRAGSARERGELSSAGRGDPTVGLDRAR